MTRENLIEKLQKLLALADSEKNDSRAEVEAAMRKVNQLLAENNLTIEQVTAAQTAEEQAISQQLFYAKRSERKDVLLKDKYCDWFLDLGRHIGYATYCDRLLTPTSVTFIGRAADAQVASFLLSNLFHRLVSLSRTAMHQYMADFKAAAIAQGKTGYATNALLGHGHDNAKIWRLNWLEGAVQSIGETLRKARQAIEHQPGLKESSRALAIIQTNEAAIADYIQVHYPKAKDVASSKIAYGRYNEAGYEQGRADGKNIEIQSGLNQHTATIQIRGA